MELQPELPALLRPTRERVNVLEKIMRTMPQIELKTEHYFGGGMYARVLYRPAGTLIVGKVHLKEHFYIVAKGKVQIEGTIYEGFSLLVSTPGTKRAVLALEDSVCLTVHRTNKTNLDRLEKELVEPDDLALYDARNRIKSCLG